MRGCLTLLVVVAAHALAGCSRSAPPPQITSQPQASQSSALPAAERPQALLPDGATIQLELALTRDEITQGLMFRPSLAADHGMLFIFPELTYPSFWMKNTWVALDIVFLDAAGRVVDVAADARPCPAEPCPRFVPSDRAMAVLELVAGAAKQHGLEPGLQIELVNVPGYPPR